MLILDTNVLSELMRAKPNDKVIKWFAAQRTESLFTTAVTQAEILYGVAILSKGKRRNTIEAAVNEMFEKDFEGRILSFDSSSAKSYAHIVALRRAAGKPISQFDAQIAAIAHSRHANLATRNTDDFQGCDIVVIDPWNEITS